MNFNLWTTSARAAAGTTLCGVHDLPDPDWYLDNVLVEAEPGSYGTVQRGPVAAWRAWWNRQSADLSGIAVAQGFVVTTAQLPLIGSARHRAGSRIRRGTWTSAGYGAIAPLDIRDGSEYLAARRRHALMCAASALNRPDHVVSGRSAAILHGLPTFTIPERPELTSARVVGLGRRGPVHVRGATLRIEEVTTWFGVPTTTVARTLVDLARHDRRDAIMAVDAALHEGVVQPDAYQAALADCRGWPGIRQAREVLALAEPRTESPLESLTRLALHDDGFPMPEPQVWIEDLRVDFLWPALRTVLEVDGLEKYTDDAFPNEKKRERRLRRLGYRVERVMWDDVVHQWPATRRWLRAALRLPT